MHFTASVFINDEESGLHHDYEVWLEKIARHEPVSGYRHNVGEDNADAHHKRQIMGREVVVAITDTGCDSDHPDDLGRGSAGGPGALSKDVAESLQAC